MTIDTNRLQRITMRRDRPAARRDGEDRPPMMAGASRSLSTSWSVTLLALLAVFYTAWFAAPILLPLTVGMFVAAVLLPIVRLLMITGLPRTLAIALTLTACVSFVVTSGVALLKPAAEWLDRAPAILKKIDRQLNPIRKPIEKVQDATRQVEELTNIDDDADETVVVRDGNLMNGLITAIPVMAGYLMLLVVLVFFLLQFGESLLHHIVATTPPGHAQRRMKVFFARITREVSRYALTITLINIGLGAVCAAALAMLGFPNPVLWGAMAGLLNFAPYVGPAIAVAILSIVSVVTYDAPWQIVAPPLAVAALTIIEGQLVTPVILGRRLSLNPLLIFVWVMLWTWLWGIAGALVATPMLACLRIIVRARPFARTRVPSVMAQRSALNESAPSSGAALPHSS